MDDPNRVRLRDAMLAYTVLALKELRSAGISLAPQGGGWGWRSRGEGQFAYASPASASDFTIHFELAKQHETEEYAACVDALRGHPVNKDRLNTLVGTTFSASRVDLESLPDQLVLGLLDQDADRLDESRFDAAFAELYTWLIRDHETFAVIAPLLGLNLEGAPLKLEPDIEIDRMSNDEAVAAITAGLIKGGGPPGFVALRETERAAIRIRTELPILVGDDEPGRATADAESLRRIWSDIVEAVIQALRLFKQEPFGFPASSTPNGIRTAEVSIACRPATPISAYSARTTSRPPRAQRSSSCGSHSPARRWPSGSL
jgi:hypothetical protein